MKKYFYINRLCVLISIVLSSFNSIAATYSGGSGTDVDPYKISTNTDLLTLSATPGDWGAYFILTTDLNMTGENFTGPIGYTFPEPSLPFTGIFDGNNYEINNLTVTVDESYERNGGVGFFGAITGKVQNLGLKDVTIDGSGKNRVGAIAGQLHDGGTISNCYVLGGSVTGNGWTGSIAGVSFSGGSIIRNCFSNATVTGGWSSAAIMGQFQNSGATIENVAFYGVVNGKPGIAAVNSGLTVTVNNAFYISTSGALGDDHGISKTPEALMLQANYSGFDFTTPAWTMKSDCYAVLSSFPIDNFNDLCNTVTGIKEITTENEVSLYPVPVSDVLTIHSKAAVKSMSIFNTVGKLVLNVEVTDNAIQVENLKPGLYFAKIEREHGDIVVSKFIKK